MPLLVYNDAPFTTGNEVDQDDVYTGDGVTTAFTLSRKSVSRLAGTVQFDNTQYFQYNSGFSRTASGFQTNTPPGLGTQGVAPGLSGILFDQLFDASSVPGVTNPNIQEVPFYLADSTQAPIYGYHALPGASGIQISFADLVSAATAALTWVQLACASGDGPGLPLTYQATGTSLYTADIYAYGTLMASANTNASSLQVDSASTFILGDYIMINGGQPTQEITKVIGFTPPTTLIIVGTNFQHFTGEVIYTCGRKFWMKCTVPFGAAQGQATNFYNLSLRTQFTQRSRL